MKNGYRHTALYRGILVCKSKKTYATRDRAKTVQKKIRRETGKLLRPYLCDQCHCWHLKTHRPKDVRPRERSEKAAIRAVVGTDAFARSG